MPTIDTKDPRIGFARVTIKVDSIEILAKSISYGDSIEFGQIEGNANMSLGTSDGMYKADEGSLEVYAEEYALILDAFKNEYFDKSFEISVAYDSGSGSKLKADTLIGCRWTKRATNDQSGPDALTRTLSFLPAYIKMNGQDPRKKMPTGAK